MLHRLQARLRHQQQDFDDITTVASGKDTVSIAMEEIKDGTLSFVKEDFDEDIKGANVISE